MSTLPLELRWNGKPMRSASALFLAGNDAVIWLEKLTATPLEQARLFLVAESRANSAIAGLFVVFIEAIPNMPGLLCGEAVEDVYLPVEGDFFPKVASDELTRLFPFYLTFCHPTLGFIGFEKEDEFALEKLLEPPSLGHADWNKAAHPDDLNRHLVSIRLLVEPSPLFEEEAKSIGSEPIPPPKKRQQKPGPPPLLKPGASRNQPGGGIAMPGAFGGLVNWVGKSLEAVRKSLEANRTKTLRDLLENLGKNPEEALRRAIPLGGHGQRGSAAPGDQLANRDANFNLGRLGGGRAADLWDIPPDLQIQLRSEYIRLANREIQLGNFRRAAYIYAELLGDLFGAANVLKQGKHFREAAILYRDHLLTPISAANCFEEGGLLPEALEFYEKVMLHEDAGRVHRKMGNEVLAEKAYRAAISKLTATGHPIEAAKLLDKELQAAAEAREMLLGCWPGSSQAVTAMELYFEWCRRDRLDDEVNERLHRFKSEPISKARFTAAVTLISGLNSYPNPATAEAAADLTRVLVGKALAERSEAADVGKWTQLVAQLEPEDAQLRRDAARFVNVVAAEMPKRPAVDALQPKVVATFQLPAEVRWKAFASSGSCFFAAGFEKNGRGTQGIRGLWNGRLQTLEWPQSTNTSGCYLLAVDQFQPTQVFLCDLDPDANVLQNTRMPVVDAFAPEVSEMGTPFWMESLSVQLIDANHEIVAALGPDFTLSVFSRTGGLLSMTEIPTDVMAAKALVIFPNQIVVAAGSTLRVVDRSGTSPVPFPDICSVVAPPSNESVCVVITTERAEIFWLESKETRLLADDMDQPLTTFLRDGRVVLLDENELRVYALEGETGPIRVERAKWKHERPISILPTAKRREFAAFYRDGTVTVIAVPA